MKHPQRYHRFRIRKRDQNQISVFLPTKYKSPGLAAFFSLIVPGLGQFYNGHFGKGILVLLFSPLVIPYLLGIGDAYFSARRICSINDHFLYYSLLERIDVDSPTPSSLSQKLHRAPSELERSKVTTDMSESDIQLARWEKRTLYSSALIGFGVLTGVGFFSLGGGLSLALFGLIPLLGGGLLTYFSLRKRQIWKKQKEREEDKRLEKIVLTVAQKKAGILSVADLVVATDLGMEEAEALLNRLVTKGFADVQVSEKGLLEYHFLLH